MKCQISYQVISFRIRLKQSMLNSSMSMSYSIRKYKFRFRAQTTTDTMSQEGTKRIQPKRQTLDDAYSPPGEPPVFS